MGDFLGETAIRSMVTSAIAKSGVSDGDVYLRRTLRRLARFSVNSLNQHIDVVEETATARAAEKTQDGYRVASVTTADCTSDGIAQALVTARSIARIVEPIEGWPGFVSSDEPAPSPMRVAQATMDCTPRDRASHVGEALELCRQNSLVAAGSLETSGYEISVGNTQGLFRYTAGTTAQFRMFALTNEGVSGYSHETNRDINLVDTLACAKQAISKAIAGKDPVALPAGSYDIVLEPAAVIELLEWMAFTAFGAKEVSDGTSPLAGNLGKSITGPKVTLVDDANAMDAVGYGIPFDREGGIRKRVVLIDQGVACEPVYDRLYASRMSKTSTGHASPPGNDDGPVPQSIRMLGGSDIASELPSRIKRGIYVTRFHYVNGFLDPRKALMTGLTRDGTFLIEDGKLTRGVKNMRFTDSVLQAFERIDGISQNLKASPTWWSDAGAFAAPTLLIRQLRFTGGGVE